jgi:hypothetical protein
MELCVITIDDTDRIFVKRMLRIAVEHLVPGARMNLQFYMKGGEKYYQGGVVYEFRNPETPWFPTYQIR